MDRRRFLKILASAVVAPSALLKAKSKTLWCTGKDESVIIGENSPGIRGKGWIIIYDEFVSSNDVLYFKNIPLHYREYLQA